MEVFQQTFNLNFETKEEQTYFFYEFIKEFSDNNKIRIINVKNKEAIKKIKRSYYKLYKEHIKDCIKFNITKTEISNQNNTGINFNIDYNCFKEKPIKDLDDYFKRWSK